MYIKGYTYNPQPNRPPPRHCLQHRLPRAVGHLHRHRSANGIGGQFEGRVHGPVDVLNDGAVAWWLPGWWPPVGWGFNKGGVGMSCFKHFAGWFCWERAGIAVGSWGFWRFNAKLAVAGGWTNPIWNIWFRQLDDFPKIGVKLKKMNYLVT